MTFNRRSFLAVLAGVACSVLGAVYGVVSEVGDGQVQTCTTGVPGQTAEDVYAAYHRWFFSFGGSEPRGNFVIRGLRENVLI